MRMRSLALPEEGAAATGSGPEAVPDAPQQDASTGDGDDEPPPPKRGHLRIVK